MKKTLRYFISKLGRPPYSCSLKLLRLASKIFNLNAEVWPRNSYVLNALEPGYSDLDITLYIKTPADANRLEAFVLAYNKIKNFFPLLGEINIYMASAVEYILKNHNGFELMRDPILCARHKISRAPDPLDAAVFLFRQLETDIQNLQKHPEKRIKKWRSHIEMIDRTISEYKLTDHVPFKEDKLIETISYSIIKLNDIWDPKEVEELKEKLYFYFEMKSKNIDFTKAAYLIKTDAWFTVCAAFRNTNADVATNNFTDKQIKFLIRQLQWEVCGVLTQISSIKTAIMANKYFEKITATLQSISYISGSAEIRNLQADISEAATIAKSLANE